MEELEELPVGQLQNGSRFDLLKCHSRGSNVLYLQFGVLQSGQLTT